MKLLRVRMMRPYLCLMGGNGVFCEQVIQGAHGGRSRGQGGGRCFDLDIPPPTPPAATASSASAGSAGRGIVIDNSERMIKLIKPDGVVTLYERPIKASELMEEYPKHRVCRSDSFYIGQKIPHLSEHDKLQKGHTYFLLPSHIFHSVLSFVTIASFASQPPPPPRPPPPPPPQPSTSTQPPPASVLGAAAANSNINNSVTASLRSKREEEEQMKSRAAILKKAAGASRMSSSSPPAFDIQKTKSGTLRIRVSEVFISQLIMDQQRDYEKEEEAELEKEEEEKKKRLLCTTPQLHKDYKQLVMGSRVRHWKPKLDMISETSSTTIININTPNKEKRKALLSSASFGIRRNKKPSSSTTSSSCKITNTRESSSSSSNQSSSSSSNSANQQRQQQHVLDDQPVIHGQSKSDQRELVLLVPSSKSTSTAKPPTACKCKLRRFKLKLRGLTTTTTSTSTSSTSTPASSNKSRLRDSKHSIYNS